MQVTTWFIVQGEQILIPASNIGRNWVRNVRSAPQVELSVGGDKFSGQARFLESAADCRRVRASVQRKYWIGGPLLAILELLAFDRPGSLQLRRFRSIFTRLNPLIALLSADGIGRGGHADEFAEYIDAVMDEKALDHEICFGLAGRVQVVVPLCHPIGAAAALLNNYIRRYSPPGAKLHQ
jgi:F420H(2)-dependent quinone reductase